MLYSKRTGGRLFIVCLLFIPLFMHSVNANTWIEIYVFVLAVFGIRSIAFSVIPEKERQ